MSMEEELRDLEVKLRQLKLDYEQYFLGARPREPGQARREVQKIVMIYSSTPIKNTAERFKFQTLHQRFQTFKRQWDATLRQMEAGTYKRDLFKANLHERERALRAKPVTARPQAEQTSGRLFDAYVEAARACGQNVSNLTPEKLDAVVAKQEAAIRKKFDCERVHFQVIVRDGKVKLKAQRAG